MALYHLQRYSYHCSLFLKATLNGYFYQTRLSFFQAHDLMHLVTYLQRVMLAFLRGRQVHSDGIQQGLHTLVFQGTPTQHRHCGPSQCHSVDRGL